MWMRFEASPPTDPTPPPDGPRGPSAESIASWSAGFAGWCFEMSAWKVKALQQPLEDWLAPLPAPDADPETAPEPANDQE